ncbi:unnamed protein product, partial [Brenthis ino]
MVIFLGGFQGSRGQYSSNRARSGPISITEALSTIVAYLPFNSFVGPNSHGENPRSSNAGVGRNYVLPFINSVNYDTRRFTLEEKATLMVFITHGIQNLLTELKIQSDDLAYLLRTLIVKDEVTILQRLSGLIDHNHQDRFVDLFNVVKVHQSNIAAVQNLLNSYQTMNAWRSALQRNQMSEVLTGLHDNVSSISESSATLWREYDWIWSM